VNVSVRYTFEMAPVHSLIEDVVLGKVMDMMGWAAGGDGLFNAGMCTRVHRTHEWI